MDPVQYMQTSLDGFEDVLETVHEGVQIMVFPEDAIMGVGTECTTRVDIFPYLEQIPDVQRLIMTWMFVLWCLSA